MSVQFCVSEHEANGKLCVLGTGADTHARQGHCIGSECMAWRWVETHIKDPEWPEGTRLIASSDTHGYCGLAGKPWGVK